MVVEMQRCHELGIGDLVVHPGAHMGTGEETGLRRIALAIDELHRRTQDLDVTIDLETTAGQGTSLGHRFDHLQSILELVTRPPAVGSVRGHLPHFRGGLFPGSARTVR